MDVGGGWGIWPHRRGGARQGGKIRKCNSAQIRLDGANLFGQMSREDHNWTISGHSFLSSITGTSGGELALALS